LAPPVGFACRVRAVGPINVHGVWRKWDFNARLLKSSIDRDRQLAPNNEKCIDQAPTEQREIQRTLTEPIEHSQRHRIT
jgi:hypothetical protein